MENRYDGLLQANNRVILDLTPANGVLRVVLALLLWHYYRKRPNQRILEIGCGEGDSIADFLALVPPAHPYFQLDATDVVLLDSSEEMIAACRRRFATFTGMHLGYVCDDALKWLEWERQEIVTSSWTIHNFKWPEKIVLFKEICKSLPEGGVFLLMDKIYPDTGVAALLEAQCRRYGALKPDVRDAIIAHEREDATDEYRMEETQTIAFLHEIGFSSVEIIDRVERDVVLVCVK
jgi:ubiquinone/menaquinone biosynthesis C-methylase UbiE